MDSGNFKCIVSKVSTVEKVFQETVKMPNRWSVKKNQIASTPSSRVLCQDIKIRSKIFHKEKKLLTVILYVQIEMRIQKTPRLGVLALQLLAKIMCTVHTMKGTDGLNRMLMCAE